MKTLRKLFGIGLALAMAVGAGFPVYSQNSAPAPGSGGAFTPNPGGPGGPPPMGPGPGVYNPGPPPPANWGNPWGGGWTSPYYSPPIVVSTPLSTPNWQNSGVENVVACGYDAQGVWRTIPLRVAYTYNGVQYDVNVLAAWNPWTDTWNRDVDAPAFNTSYFLNGETFNFYTNLSTGTYYFNL